MTPHDTIAALESTSSRNEKHAIMKQALLSLEGPVFYRGLVACYDPFITYGVKKIPVRDGTDGTGLDFSTFQLLLDSLSRRELTGNAAKKTIEHIMSQATNAEWNGWYRRILLRDMKAGFTEGTVNRAIDEINDEVHDITYGRVRTYSCQLAHPAKKYPKKMTGKKFLEVKYDGARLNVYVHPNGDVRVLSREGKLLENFTYIEEQFASVAHTLREETMFDGEVMSQAFYDLMRQLRRKTNVDTSDATFAIFDMVPAVNMFRGETYDVSQRNRKEALFTWFQANADALSSCTLLEYVEVDLNTEEGRRELARFNAHITEAAKIDKKVEGTMYKDPDAPYECGRTDAWLKEKPFIDVTLEIVGYEPGDPEGRNKDCLGAFLCKGFDLDRHIEVAVGGGFKQNEREDFWSRRDELLGMLIEVRADCFTENEKKPGIHSLRFPEFLRFRGRSPGEKI